MKRISRLGPIEWMVISAVLLVLLALGIEITATVRGWAVKSGVVTMKEFYPAYTTTRYSGQNNSVAVPEYHPERYVVTVEGNVGEDEVRARRVQVDPIGYQSIKIGQRWTEAGGFE